VIEYLDLADYLLIAEAVTGIDAVVLGKVARIELAESALAAPQASFEGIEFYPEFVAKAAVLCARLAWNHPLPDGNKRAAWVCLREFCARNRCRLVPTSVDDAVGTMEALAAHEIDEEQLAIWIADRISPLGN
jgi:death on curing protein